MSYSIELLIATIRNSPSMYVGQYSITRFRAFLDGYTYAKQEAGEDMFDRALWVSFSGKVTKRYGIRTSHDWSSILLFMAGNEKDALDLFWQLWDEHIQDVRKKSKQK